jgi:hypothetical protein
LEELEPELELLDPELEELELEEPPCCFWT